MQTIHKYGFYNLATAIPSIRVADISYNTEQILKLIEEASEKSVSLLAFPELCLTGATCGDLFLQKNLQQECKKSILHIAHETRHIPFPIILGSPIAHGNRLFNCAVILMQGKIKGFVPKQLLSQEEKRYFTSLLPKEWDYIDWNEDTCFYFDGNLMVNAEDSPEFTFAIEMGEDYKGLNSASKLCLYKGTRIIVNPSALPSKIGEAKKRLHSLIELSAANSCIYLHVNAGFGESTTHNVYSGESYILEAGQKIAASTPYRPENQLIVATVDLDKIDYLQKKSSVLINEISQKLDIKLDFIDKSAAWYKMYPSEEEGFYFKEQTPLLRALPQFPFIPEDAAELEERCQEISSMICTALRKRLSHIHSEVSVIGVSGGLDSTLALLFLMKTYQEMNLPIQNIIGVRMPGFGTSGETYQNSCKLMDYLGITQREVDIKASVLQHLNDISHPIDKHDTTYENAQARERTQILMDISNQTGGIVIGTGDLSELALGFCTYNGDHMSMYSLNASIPKTLIPYIIRSLGKEYDHPELISVLEKIIDTPISPELLPPNANQQILQRTEELIGPYALHDFFLYYMIRYGFSPSKIRALAVKSFENIFSYEEVDKWIRVFYKRFFSQQFKRNCLPDSPAISEVSLFYDFVMPSDAMADLWLKELD